jgi:hypothetical protein
LANFQIRSLGYRASKRIRPFVIPSPFTVVLVDTVLIVLVVAIAFWIRAKYVNFGLPYAMNWDEWASWGQGLSILLVPGLKPPPAYTYGDLMVYLTAAAQVLGFLNGLRTGEVQSLASYASLPAGVLGPAWAVGGDGEPLHYPRLMFALFGALACVPIYVVVRRHLRANACIAAAAALIFALFSLQVTSLASTITPDSLVATLFAFMMLATAQYLDEIDADLFPIVMVAAMAGVIQSLKLQYQTVLFVATLALLLAPHRKHLVRNILIASVVSFVSFAVTSPYWFLDLPGHLSKLESAAHDSGGRFAASRLDQLAYYVQATFLDPGSLGPAAGVLTLIGLVAMAVRRPRFLVVMGTFSAMYLFFITQFEERYVRLVVILYPFACVAAGLGAEVVARAVARWLPLRWRLLAPAGMLVAVVVLSLPQITYAVSHAREIEAYQPPQTVALGYLRTTMGPNDKLGVFDFLPWIDADLTKAGIKFERIAVTDSAHSLRSRGITLVAGTDRLQHPVLGLYPFDPIRNLNDTIWDAYLQQPGVKLAEFGSGAPAGGGAPLEDQYIFISRVPADDGIVSVSLDPLPTVVDHGHGLTKNATFALPVDGLDSKLYHVIVTARGDPGGSPGDFRQPIFTAALLRNGTSVTTRDYAPGTDYVALPPLEITVQAGEKVTVQLTFADDFQCVRCGPGQHDEDRNVWIRSIAFHPVPTQ